MWYKLSCSLSVIRCGQLDKCCMLGTCHLQLCFLFSCIHYFSTIFGFGFSVPKLLLAKEDVCFLSSASNILTKFALSVWVIVDLDCTFLPVNYLVHTGIRCARSICLSLTV